jgi:hypothetical protein
MLHIRHAVCVAQSRKSAAAAAAAVAAPKPQKGLLEMPMASDAMEVVVADDGTGAEVGGDRDEEDEEDEQEDDEAEVSGSDEEQDEEDDDDVISHTSGSDGVATRSKRRSRLDEFESDDFIDDASAPISEDSDGYHSDAQMPTMMAWDASMSHQSAPTRDPDRDRKKAPSPKAARPVQLPAEFITELESFKQQHHTLLASISSAKFPTVPKEFAGPLIRFKRLIEKNIALKGGRTQAWAEVQTLLQPLQLNTIRVWGG